MAVAILNWAPPASSEQRLIMLSDSAFLAVVLFPGNTMEIKREGTKSNPFPLIIHVAATSTTIVVVVLYLGMIPKHVVIGDITFLRYDVLYFKAALKRQ